MVMLGKLDLWFARSCICESRSHGVKGSCSLKENIMKNKRTVDKYIGLELYQVSSNPIGQLWPLCNTTGNFGAVARMDFTSF